MITKITIFTDGSSRGNPGSGGWAGIVVGSDKVIEIGGRDQHTTNNRMEMVAAIESLKKIDEVFLNNSDGDAQKTSVTINTDSAYLINGITKWVHGWKKNNWITSQKKDVENRDLWEQLLEKTFGKNISWNYVGGHVGIVGNERCDEIATSYADGAPVELYSGIFSDYSIKNILDVSHDAAVLSQKKSSGSRSKAKAYSYISSIKGDVKVHATWAQCEARVKGVKGARFKKALDKDEEASLIKEFGK